MYLDEAKAPDGLRLYAIGDIHGRLDLLDQLLARIDEDLAAAPPDGHRIIALGDYCDRGPDTRGVIDRLIAESRNGLCICLRGNHDDWMLRAVYEPQEAMAPWLRWGGRATLRSYAVEPDCDDIFAISREFARNLPAAHRKFLEGLASHHIAGDYCFVHAGLQPGVALKNQSPHDMMWIRNSFLMHRGSFGKVVIHGHTRGDRIEVHPNRINVDTGAWTSGILSCVVLEGDTRRFLRATGSPSHGEPF